MASSSFPPTARSSMTNASTRSSAKWMRRSAPFRRRNSARRVASMTPPNATLRSVSVPCALGATYQVAPRVMEALGAQVYCIGCAPDGFNINHHVGTMHPQALIAAVCERGADLGIAFDGDGDRVQMVDSRGQLVDGDDLL